MTSNPLARNPLGSARPSSARALLLVMIGEFVWPAGQPAWSATLLSGLAEFGIEPNAARKALQRIAATGITTSGRQGNRVHWTVTAKGDRILKAGWERTYGWHARATEWDGRWLVLSVTVPETQRKLRHHLQNRLLWAGLGSPAPGEWLTPHAERGEQVAQIVQELGLSDQAHSFVGNLGPVGDPQRLIASAWNLGDLEKDYRAFIDGYAGRAPRTDQEHFGARVELVQDWRRFPYLDPEQGWVRMSGRLKDIINRGGETFSALDIESAIAAHPDVAAVAVTAIPDERLGEAVGAWIVLAAGVEWHGPQRLVEHLEAARLARQKIPVQWTVVPSLPTTASGKIQKNKLVTT